MIFIGNAIDIFIGYLNDFYWYIFNHSQTYLIKLECIQNAPKADIQLPQNKYRNFFYVLMSTFQNTSLYLIIIRN